jgi:hypothetical protein
MQVTKFLSQGLGGVKNSSKAEVESRAMKKAGESCCGLGVTATFSQA